MVFFGIRTSLKEDLGHSSAELLYSTPLRLPCEFLASILVTQPCSIQDYVTSLTDIMQKLQPVPPRISPKRTFVNQDLDDCLHVFIHVNEMKKPVQQLFDRPYRFVKRTRKITIDHRGTNDVISIDRAKYLLSENTLNSIRLPTLPQDTPATKHRDTNKKKISFLLPRH
ncbi:uncharacterized protein LOC143039294 [Oratosquilla oratoria]|uniref:uncharacterized protein LOC143039294 n=1 Tax=Oratosquilla oratoria TaxID=337810 RepID=UPI003F7736CA